MSSIFLLLDKEDFNSIKHETDQDKLKLAKAHSAVANALTATTDLEKRTHLVFLIAESAKIEAARIIYTDSQIFAPLAVLLASDSDLAKIQVLRAFANLCFNNDANRDLLYEAENAIAGIVECIESKNPQVLKNCLGSLLNVSMDNEPIEIEIIERGGLESLLDIVNRGAIEIFSNENDTDYDQTFLALQLLSNIVECDRAAGNLLDHLDKLNDTGLICLFKLIRLVHARLQQPALSDKQYDQSLEFLDALVCFVETICEDEEIQRAIVQDGFFDALLDFVDHKLLRQASTTSLDESSSSTSNVPSYREVRKLVSKITTVTTMNDENMKELSFSLPVLARLKRWMELGDGGREEDEIRMAGALCIGNLARSDQTCEALVKIHNVVPALMKLFSLEMIRLNSAKHDITQIEEEERKEAKDELKSIVQVIHAVIGALKNLSLAPCVRDEIGSTGIIEFLAEFLVKDGVKLCQFGAIGVFKNLCQENERNTHRLITGTELVGSLADAAPTYGTPLKRLVKFLWKAVDDNDTGIRSEGGRCIANMVRCCHHANAPGFIKIILEAKGVPLLVQIVTGATLTLHATSQDFSDRVVHLDAVPNEANVFPIVLNEGVVSLMLMCTVFPETAYEIVRFEASLLPTLIRVIKSEDERSEPGQIYADEIKANVCLLLECLCRADAEFRTRAREHVEELRFVENNMQSVKKSGGGISLSEALERVLQLL